MSTPDRPYALDPTKPDEVSPCCEGKAPYPTWWMFYQLGAKSLAEQEPEARARATATLMNPDRLRCPRCSTTLEDFRDNFAESAPQFLDMIASVVAFVPGFGTVAAYVLSTVASLVKGKNFADALAENIVNALPGGFAWAAAATVAKDVIYGQRFDQAVSDGVRAAIREEGGELAAAAYDGVVAVVQGKTIQDAGFASLSALAKGNEIGERAANYFQATVRAVEQGQSPVGELIDALGTELYVAGGDQAAAFVGDAVRQLQAFPQLASLGSGALADALGVAEPFARAAQAILRDGAPDADLKSALVARVDEQRRARLFAETAVALPSRLSPMAAAAIARTQARAELLRTSFKPIPGGLRNTNIFVHLEVTAPPVVFVVAPPGRVATPEPITVASSGAVEAPPAAPPRNVKGDLALGGVVAAAGVALFFWATAKK